MIATIAPAQAATYGSCSSGAGYSLKYSKSYFEGGAEIMRIKIYTTSGWYKCAVVDKIANNGAATYVKLVAHRHYVDNPPWQVDAGNFLYYAGPIYLGYARNICVSAEGTNGTFRKVLSINTEDLTTAGFSQCQLEYAAGY
jgi:hypothetical protein